MFKPARALLFASLTALLAASSPSVSSPNEGYIGDLPMSPPSSMVRDLPLSILTYNVMGLPWPVAFGRDEALGRIADRLAGLRAQRRQPHIVLIQEGFVADPIAFARRAGYAHVAGGPDMDMRSTIVASAADLGYLRAARWDRGETLGKRLNSGLIILSDYPIVAVHRMAYPAFACAGFDCLANKGAMIAHLRVPGIDRPVAVVNTHLNARKAAGVSIARSLRAFDRQAGLLAGFVAHHVPRDRNLLLGGDLNIGGDRQRIRAFFAHWRRTGLDFVAASLGGSRQAKVQALLTDPADRHDLNEAVLRSKDWIFARNADGAPMKVAAAQIAFGGPADRRLSDHVGYAIGYDLRRPRPLRFADAGAR